MRGEQFGRILGALVLTAKLEGCGPGTSEVKQTEAAVVETQQGVVVETVKTRTGGGEPSKTTIKVNQDGKVTSVNF